MELEDGVFQVLGLASFLGTCVATSASLAVAAGGAADVSVGASAFTACTAGIISTSGLKLDGECGGGS